MGGIAHYLGRDRALLVAFPDNADEVSGCRAVRRGDILQGQTGDLMNTRAELPGQGDHGPVPDAGLTIVLQADFHKLVELGDRDIPAGFDACGAAATWGFGHQAALGGLAQGLALLGRQQAAQGGIVQEQVTDAINVPAQGGQDAGDVRGGVVLSRQILEVFFDQGLIDRPAAAPQIKAQHVAAIGALGEHRAEDAGGAELVIKHAGEVRDEPVQETVAVLDKYDLGGFGCHEILGILVKVSK